MENEKLRNEFILKESNPGKIISELLFKEFKVIGIDNQFSYSWKLGGRQKMMSYELII